MSVRRFPLRARPHSVAGESLLQRSLDPIDRLSEAVYSILIVLTFTLAYSIFRLSGDPDSLAWAGYGSDLFFAVTGATVAWGIVDGVMYALMSVLERGERHRLLQKIQAATTEEEAVSVIADELDYILEPIASEDQRHMLYLDTLAHLREGQPQPVGLQRGDLAGALGSLLVAVVVVLPSLIPLYLLRDDLALAIRVSNIVSFIALFALGYGWGRHTNANPWKIGLMLAGIGLIMVLIAILLGG